MCYTLNNLENSQLSSGTSYRRSLRTKVSNVSAQHAKPQSESSNISTAQQISSVSMESTNDLMKNVVSLVLPCAQWVATSSSDHVEAPMASIVSVPFTPLCFFLKDVQSDPSNR